jgi:hypothetical protein
MVSPWVFLQPEISTEPLHMSDVSFQVSFSILNQRLHSSPSQILYCSSCCVAYSFGNNAHTSSGSVILNHLLQSAWRSLLQQLTAVGMEDAQLCQCSGLLRWSEMWWHDSIGDKVSLAGRYAIISCWHSIQWLQCWFRPDVPCTNIQRMYVNLGALSSSCNIIVKTIILTMNIAVVNFIYSYLCSWLLHKETPWFISLIPFLFS